MPISEADPRASRAGEEVPRHGRAGLGQLLRHAELAAGLLRRLRSSTCRPGVRCPMELSTFFRINERNTGQFERTLIIADKGAYVSYLEGCTAPQRDENQLHAAVVELVAPRRCRDQVLDGPELVPRQFRRQGRHLQLRHQARRLPRRPLEDLLDPGRDRLGHHLEISELHPARRRLARRVLFDRDFERLSAGR